MRLGWLSDIHLNFLDEAAARRFVAGLAGHQADAWVVTGDIGEARSLAGYLRLFSEESPVPTYINLGNHDFYGGAIETTTAALQTVVEAESRLVWLNATGLQLLADQVALVGDDNWAPWFTCRAVGEAIDACAQEHPATQFLVLCGHTHGSGTFAPLDNVIVHTAAADYGAPRVQRVFEFA